MQAMNPYCDQVSAYCFSYNPDGVIYLQVKWMAQLAMNLRICFYILCKPLYIFGWNLKHVNWRLNFLKISPEATLENKFTHWFFSISNNYWLIFHFSLNIKFFDFLSYTHHFCWKGNNSPYHFSTFNSGIARLFWIRWYPICVVYFFANSL